MAYAITGDPELPIWTDRPGVLQFQGVTQADDRLAVTVVDAGGKPVADALVTVWLAGDLARRQLYQTARTDAAGRVAVPLGGVSAGQVQVTAAKHNYIPVSIATAAGERLSVTVTLAEPVPHAYRQRLATCRISQVGQEYLAAAHLDEVELAVSPDCDGRAIGGEEGAHRP